MASVNSRLSLVGRCVGLGKCVREGLIVVFAESALTFAVQMEKMSKIYGEVPD